MGHQGSWGSAESAGLTSTVEAESPPPQVYSGVVFQTHSRSRTKLSAVAIMVSWFDRSQRCAPWPWAIFTPGSQKKLQGAATGGPHHRSPLDHACADWAVRTRPYLLRAGFTDVLVTGMLTRWISVRQRPTAIGARPRGACVSVEPMMTRRKKKVITTSHTRAAKGL
jgi:hypothetical protein